MTTETDKRRVAVGVFDSREKAEAAIDDLASAGFLSRDIGIAAGDTRGDWHDFRTSDEAPNVGAGAAAGAATGAGIGGLWALGIAAGILPAIGPIIAGGLLASILASAATGAAAGGLLGALLGLGLSEDEARIYEREFASGKVIVTVRAPGRFDEAMQILESHGALDVRSQVTNGVA